MELPVETLGVGTVVAEKYRIEGEIGRGGMGIVYKAEDLKLGRPVALKFLPPDLVGSPELTARFLVEARAAGGLSHPNICVVHEVGDAVGRSYIAMEYVEGENLRKRIERGPLAATEALDIAIQVAAGLGEAHRKGVIHRDIKSANIMVTPEGRTKVMDFGLAKLGGGSDLTKRGTTMGTVSYMSPEQALGQHVDQISDLWSLGVVLYEMLTGDLPFKGDTELSVLHSIAHEEPRPLKGIEPPVPEELKRVISRALRKQAQARYGSAEEMGEELRAFQASRRLAEADALSARALFRRLRRPRVAASAVAVLLALVALGSWYSWRRARVRWAREIALPEIERIVSQNSRDFDEAYALAERAEEVIPHDPKLAELFSKFSFRIDVRTTPPGAKVYVKAYKSPQAEWKYLGISPVRKVRLPLGAFRWKLEKEGYATVLAAAMSASVRTAPHVDHVGADLVRVLDRAGSIPPGMVRVAGAETDEGPLDDFFIDRYEVTNKEYRKFVDGGGYRNRSYWKNEFPGFLSFIVQNGRAVLYPVYKGTFERGSNDVAAARNGDRSSHLYTELLVQEVKDFERSIDYLETRPDIDGKRLAYYGMSWGGALGAIIPAVEERLQASVLLSGGFRGNPRPEADPVSYVTRVKVPTLMLNGKYDTILPPETSQQPMYDLLGARDKKRVLDDSDHIPTTNVYIRETLAWLDRTLGPVR